ncbi:endoribonuclease MazF [Campylobacter volucris]|uniref:endoribonuclease MazF n=1 Tax=Campylobacter volucris TaxID=1031542 RepID=UPI0018A0EB20|nr:endoribonuclease MazF [Campylobacter volucris]MBF7047429.1 endoribonuclease MazF [Campylobacter volucris]
MNYIPNIGDIIWIDFDPQAGHEQAKRRPAVVLTPKAYNDKTSLIICIPLTTKIKNYPFEVDIQKNNSVALADHIKSFDWRARNAEFKGKISQEKLNEIKQKLGLLLGF